jgi:hypothetical protein
MILIAGGERGDLHKDSVRHRRDQIHSAARRNQNQTKNTESQRSQRSQRRLGRSHQAARRNRGLVVGRLRGNAVAKTGFLCDLCDSVFLVWFWFWPWLGFLRCSEPPTRLPFGFRASLHPQSYRRIERGGTPRGNP